MKVHIKYKIIPYIMFNINDEYIPFNRIVQSNFINPNTNNSIYDIVLNSTIIIILIIVLLIIISWIQLSIYIIIRLHNVNVNVFINKEFVQAMSYIIPKIIQVIIK